MKVLIHIKPVQDVQQVLDHVKKRGGTDVWQIGRLHILLAEIDGRKLKKIETIPGVSSVEPERTMHLNPPGMPQ